MTITTDECIHGLTPMTCSICLEPSHRKDEPVGSLTELVREALAAYPGEDQELVLRIVYAEAVALPNGFDLFLPYLRSILSNFDGASRRNIQREIDLPPRPSVATYTSATTAPAAFFQDEPIAQTPSMH